MDHIAVKEYVLVYFHTLTSEYNHLDSDFLKKLYDVVDVKLVIFLQMMRRERASFFPNGSRHYRVFCESAFHVQRLSFIVQIF